MMPPSELFKVLTGISSNRKCRVLKTALGAAPRLWPCGLDISGTPGIMDAIIAQNTAKRNLDFEKRHKKSAMLSGGVIRQVVFSSTARRGRHKSEKMSRIKTVDKNLYCKYYLHTKGRSMKFTWDDKKAAINKQKHGVAFEEVQTVFDDCDALRIFDPDHSEDEDRFLLLGLSSVLRLLVVCHCYRENDEQVRIISARKATKKESATYERRK